MSKYNIIETYCCSLCGKEFQYNLNAVDCYDAHFKNPKIIDIHYEKGQYCPSEIKVQFEVSKNNTEKEIKEFWFKVKA
jgi:hypothetical protein